MQKPIWIFGGLAGVIAALVEYLFYSQDPNTFDATQSQGMMAIKMVSLIICIIFGLILLRKLNGGVISIGRTILSGVLMSVVRSVILIIAFTATWYPDGTFYDGHKAIAKEKTAEIIASNDDFTEEEKQEKIEEAEITLDKQYTPQGYSVVAFLGSLVTGLVISVLMAAFIAKNMMYADMEEAGIK